MATNPPLSIKLRKKVWVPSLIFKLKSLISTFNVSTLYFPSTSSRLKSLIGFLYSSRLTVKNTMESISTCLSTFNSIILLSMTAKPVIPLKK